MALSDRDKVRLRVGDTDMTDALLTDEEYDAFITESTTDSIVNLNAAAASCAWAIAAKFSRGFNFSTDGQSFNRSERVNHYTQLARDLRRKAGASSVAVKSSVATAESDNLTLGEASS